MRTFTFLALSYLSTAAWAGGYQGCLERVWIYQAYLIDQLNAPADRTLGFKCGENDINRATRQCKVDWKACTSTSNPGGPCTYDEFFKTFGKGPSEKTWRIPETGPLDVEATAKKCFEVHTKHKSRVRNFPPYFVAKGEVEFNSLIGKVKDVVNKAYREHKTAANEDMWKLDFDETTNKILIARTGDHGPYLIRNATWSDKLRGVEIKKQNLGPNPVANPPADWETVDWTATEEEAKRNGVADAKDKIDDFLDWFYTNDNTAREHKAVIDSYHLVKESKSTCR